MSAPADLTDRLPATALARLAHREFQTLHANMDRILGQAGKPQDNPPPQRAKEAPHG